MRDLAARLLATALPSASIPALCVLAAMQPLPVLAAEAEAETEAAETKAAVTEGAEAKSTDRFFGLGWLDATQANFSNRANSLANRVDRFFGSERSDLEAAYSSLRLGTEFRWTEAEGVETHLRLRGRLYLPRINDRISLIFSEDKGEGSDYYAENAILNEPQSTRVNLEVNLGQTDKHRFDFRVGLRSNLRLRTSVRYRYENALSENMLHRLSATAYFIDGTGLGSFTQYQLDRALTDVSLIRWSNEFRAEEDLDGVEWSTSLNHVSTYDNKFAMIYFVGMSGLSENDYISRYQIGARFRRSIARPWLFLELSPSYRWDQLAANLDREGELFANIRLEMAIGRLDQ